MSRYQATIRWQRGDAAFTDNRYSRAHVWAFDGGVEVPATSSPNVVPLPLSDSTGVDPEEAFVASLASCHMLWFLSVAAKAGVVVDSYTDEAEGVMERNAEGRLAVTRVVLHPRVSYAGNVVPDPQVTRKLHRQAHEHCFISNSVRSEVLIEPV